MIVVVLVYTFSRTEYISLIFVTVMGCGMYFDITQIILAQIGRKLRDL